MTNSDDQTTPPVPPVPPVTPPEPAPAAPPVAPPAADVRPDPYAAPAYPTAPPAYAPASGPTNPYAPTGPVEPKGLSITSMVLGIVGLLSGGFGLLISIAAVITGHLGQRRQPNAKPFWLTGIITGYIGIALGLIVTIVVIIAIVAAFSYGGYDSYDQYSYNS